MSPETTFVDSTRTWRSIWPVNHLHHFLIGCAILKFGLKIKNPGDFFLNADKQIDKCGSLKREDNTLDDVKLWLEEAKDIDNRWLLDIYKSFQ